MCESNRAQLRRLAYRVAGPSLLSLLLFAVSGCDRRVDQAAARRTHVAADLRALRPTTTPVFANPLTLRDVVATALANNLDNAVAMQEERIRLEDMLGARRRMLPSMLFDLERSRRNNEAGSKSAPIFGSGRKNTNEIDPTTSEEQTKYTQSIELVWGVVDFGMAFLRSRQAEDEAHAAAQRLRRVRQNLALQVAETYWDAQVARRAHEESRELLAKMAARNTAVQRQLREKLVNRQKALEVEAKWIESQLRLRRYAQEHQRSLTRLAALMGLPPGTSFRLHEEPFDRLADAPALEVERLETIALCNRPELYERDAEERIAATEARAALLSMFPNASLFGRWDRDANRFLYEHSWYTAGVKVAMDIFSIPEKRARLHTARARQELARRQRLSLAMGILSQIRLVELECRDAQAEYALVDALLDRRQRMTEEIARDVAEDVVGTDRLIDAEEAAFLTRVRQLEAFSAVRRARSRLDNTLGLDGESIYDIPPCAEIAPTLRYPAGPALKTTRWSARTHGLRRIPAALIAPGDADNKTPQTEPKASTRPEASTTGRTPPAESPTPAATPRDAEEQEPAADTPPATGPAPADQAQQTPGNSRRPAAETATEPEPAAPAAGLSVQVSAPETAPPRATPPSAIVPVRIDVH